MGGAIRRKGWVNVNDYYDSMKHQSAITRAWDIRTNSFMRVVAVLTNAAGNEN
jgi:hypothetical protein